MDELTNIKELTLSDRTLIFLENIIKLIDTIPPNPLNNSLSLQIVANAGLIWQNYMEVDKNTLQTNINDCLNSCKEIIYWLEILLNNNKNFNSEIISLLNHSYELKAIFSSIKISI